ncbi:MAG: hypothetical protein PSW75_12520 [bacterium]|nr:hypothetical protein [bacterium]MDI1335759.1 hypothetical protein [Lacunisphaera sp.]
MAEAYLQHKDQTRTRLDHAVTLGRSSACDVTLGAGVAGGIESVLRPGVNFLFRMGKAAGAAKVRCALAQEALDAWPAPKPPTRALEAQSLKSFEGRHTLHALL